MKEKIVKECEDCKQKKTDIIERIDPISFNILEEEVKMFLCNSCYSERLNIINNY